MDTEQETVKRKVDLLAARVLAIVALILLPLALYQYGVAPMVYLATAIPVGALWLAGLLLSWRNRNEWWNGIGFVAGIFGHKVAERFAGPIPYSFFFEWLCVVILVACGPLSMFRSRVIQFCR